MSYTTVPEVRPALLDLLSKVFAGHGIDTVVEQNAVRFPAYPDRWLDGTLFLLEGFHPHIGQLDIRLALDRETVVCESVTAMGETAEAKAMDGLRVVAGSSLHVLMSAFFGAEPCHGTDVYRHTISGSERVVHLGPVQSRLGLPKTPDDQPDLSFFPEFERHLSAYPLPGGSHWVRVYLSRGTNLTPFTEVLIDNAPCDELQQAMATVYSPPPCERMDVRVFLVIQNPPSA